MKSLIFTMSAVFTVLTAVEPIWADDASTVRTSISGEEGPARLSDLDMRLNPQIGVSSFEYSKMEGKSGEKFAGGLTAEFGGPARKLETGVLLLNSSADVTLNNGNQERLNSTYMTIPMMAKLRLVGLKSQSWYLKLGVSTALLTNTNDRVITNAADVLAGAGLAGRFAFTRKADFVVEATYNRGLLEAVRSNSVTSYNQGVVVLAGLSFRI